MPSSRLPPISDYGLIGDSRTAALTSSRGSVDWLAVPDFDSDPVFSHLVGGAGEFRIAPLTPASSRRSYRRSSTVLETVWDTGGSELKLTEAMVSDLAGWLSPQTLLVRSIEVSGEPTQVAILFDPRLGLPGAAPRAERRHGVLVCSWGSLAVGLLTSPDLELRPGEERVVEVRPGEPLVTVMVAADRQPLVQVPPGQALSLLEREDRRWKAWSAGLEYEGPHRTEVERSILTLRLLTFSPSSAPVASPTTSLPEVIGGGRNWDYRFSWIRDAAIGLESFLAVGKPEVAHAYMHWLLHASRLTRPELQVLYTVYGKPPKPEREVFGVDGYRGSLPVRIGNQAAEQHQLDIYGWAVEAAHALDRTMGIHAEVWRLMAGLADVIVDRWREPDAGIWEMRGEPRHFVHSKLMAWAGLDRLLRMAERRGIRTRRVRRWEEARDALGTAIRSEGFDEGQGAYTQSFGSTDLDASLLLLPVLGFEPPGSPRVVGTIDAIRRRLEGDDFLVHRYGRGVDGMEGDEGAFLPCSFWLVRALAATGKVEEASEAFDRLSSLCGPLGLYPEEIDGSGAFLGNHPLAFSHATHVQAAVALAAASRR